jgi:hypothetical protein
MAAILAAVALLALLAQSIAAGPVEVPAKTACKLLSPNSLSANCGGRIYNLDGLRNTQTPYVARSLALPLSIDNLSSVSV